MLRGLKRWRAGYIAAALCLASGVLLAAAGETGWWAGAAVVLAAGHASAAVVARRRLNARAAVRPPTPDPTPWTTQPSRIAAWVVAGRGFAQHPDAGGGAAATRVAVLTRDRVGAGFAGAAAIAGLLLVLSEHDRPEHGPPLGPTTSSAGTAPVG